MPDTQEGRVKLTDLPSPPYILSKWRRCPRCQSSHPHRHPAVQFEGEVELCTHDFHLQRTNSNRSSYIAAVLAKRAALEARNDGELYI